MELEQFHGLHAIPCMDEVVVVGEDGVKEQIVAIVVLGHEQCQFVFLYCLLGLRYGGCGLQVGVLYFLERYREPECGSETETGRLDAYSAAHLFDDALAY